MLPVLLRESVGLCWVCGSSSLPFDPTLLARAMQAVQDDGTAFACKAGRANPESSSVTLGMLQEVWDKQGILTDDVLQCVFYILMDLYGASEVGDNGDEASGKSIAFFPCTFFSVLDKAHTDAATGALTEEAAGALTAELVPAREHKGWLKGAELIVMPVHLELEHWLLACAYPAHKTICFVDSSRRTTESHRVGIFDEWGSKIAELMWACLERMGVPHDPNEWSVFVEQHNYQQHNAYDCGMWLLLNTIARLHGNPHAGPITNIPAARRWLVEELIAAGIHNKTADARLNGVLDEERLNRAALSRVHHADSDPQSDPAIKGD